MAVSYNPKIVTDGLTFCLDAGNAKSYPGSGNNWIDIVGNNVGTLANGAVYNANNGGYILFDGVDDNVVLPSSSLSSGNEMTFCMFNYSITAKASSVVWFQNASAIRMLNIHLPFSDSILYFDAGDGSGGLSTSYDRISKTVLASEYQGWNYWCFTKNSVSGVMNVYRNGALWHTGTGKTRPIGTSSGTAYLAYSPAVGSGYHSGYLSHVSIYNRELSENEIDQNFSALRGRYGI